MTFYWILFAIAALVALVVLYFFVIGLLDGSVSSFNMLLWLALLAVTGGVLLGSWWLKSRGSLGAAKGVLLILAAPGLLYGLFVLMAIILKPRWN